MSGATVRWNNNTPGSVIIGGDEGRVARTGSGRFGASPRGGRRGPGRPVRSTSNASLIPLSPTSGTNRCTGGAASPTSTIVESSSNNVQQWYGSEGSSASPTTAAFPPPLSPSSTARTTAAAASAVATATGGGSRNESIRRHRHHHHHPQSTETSSPLSPTPEARLELRGCNPMSRSPSSVSSSSSSSSPSSPSSSSFASPSSTSLPFSATSPSSPSILPRVHGHDHNRPLPPPRLPEAMTTPASGTGASTTTTTTPTAPATATITSSVVVVPLTAPLTPLASSGLVRTRSRTPAPVPLHESSRTSSQQPASSLIVAPDDQQTTRTSTSEVTLTVPRPDGERVANEYVESPFRSAFPTAQKCPKTDHRARRNQERLNHHNHRHQQHLRNQPSHYHHHHHHHQNQNQIESQNHNRQSLRRGHNNRVCNNHHHSAATGPNSSSLTKTTNNSSIFASSIATVTKQPISFTKEPSGNSVGSSATTTSTTTTAAAMATTAMMTMTTTTTTPPSQRLPLSGTGLGLDAGVIPMDEGLSIMCDFCGRCRCESCREPPPLPSRWLCNNACFCSAETALDYASCLCCVKGLFYHCSDGGSGADSEGEGAGGCADEPCSCTGSRRQARWACLGVLAPLLPCLLCYWPFRGCVALCETCYARYASQGCRCDPSTVGRHLGTTTLRDSRDPEKRLLDPVTPEL